VRLKRHIAALFGTYGLVFFETGAIVIYDVTGGELTHMGIAIGGVVLLEAMFAGPMTAASMNRARSIAPAIVSSNLNDL